MTSQREAQLVGRLTSLVEEIAAEANVHVVEIELKGAHPHRVLRVVVDTIDLDPSAALDVDVIAEMSRRLGSVLDEQDPIPGTYTLEVTSPGADRRLTTHRDFARNRGRMIQLALAPASEDDDAQVLDGELRDVTADTLAMHVDGRDVTIALATVDHGKVVLPW